MLILILIIYNTHIFSLIKRVRASLHKINNLKINSLKINDLINNFKKKYFKYFNNYKTNPLN